MPAFEWNEALDAILTAGRDGAIQLPWRTIADQVNTFEGRRVCTPEMARSRHRRIMDNKANAVVRETLQTATLPAVERAEERAVVRRLRSELEDTAAEVLELRQLADFYRRATDEPIVVPDWRLRQRERTSGGRVGTVMASLADWHLDEVVDPAEVLGLNQFNRKIAEHRVRRWMEKLITLPRDYVNGLQIEGLIIAATGDLFTGEIHAELRETNEDKVLASLLHWQEPIIAMCETLASEYPNVEIDCVPGNHTRITEKYNHKGRVKESLEQFFWAIVRDRIADRGKAPNLTINVSPSSNMNLSVYGRNYVLDHGYEFKGGSGISGAFAPLALGSARKNIRQTVAGIPMHTMIIGHMHQLINIPGVIMGGCLKGYDEYAFDLNLRPDPDGASQAMWITSPERHQVLWMPIYLQDNEAERAL